MNKFKVMLAGAAIAALPAAGLASEFWSLGSAAGLTEGISDTGVAAGSTGNASGEYFLWTSGTGALPIGGAPPGNGIGGQAKVSNDGRYISGTTYNAAMDYHEMSKFDVMTGTWTGYGAIPGVGQQVDQEVSSGWGMSGDGLSTVGLGWTSLGTADTHAYQWKDGVGAIDLGSNAVGQSARASAVDYDGNVVAGWQDGAGRQGAVWVDGVEELIFLPGGTIAQEAFAVSDDGNWVTGLGLGSFFGAAETYRYNPHTDTTEMIPNLAVGGESRLAGADISADGSIIVGGTWGIGPATFGKAIIWQEGVGTMLLTDYLDGLGISYPAGYGFNFVSGISSDGQWLTGWGNPTGGPGNESWVIHIPEPTTGLLLALGSLALIRRR